MATTQFGVNHALSNKLFSKKLLHESLKATWFSKFIGTKSDSLIMIMPETKKSAGDKVTYGLRMLLTGDGVQGDDTLEGNEEALTFYSDSILIDQLRHAVRSAGKMSEQRVPYEVREEARQGLSDWLADRIDSGFMNQLAGNTNETSLKKTGLNSVTAPDTDHWIYSTNDGEASLSASSTFTLTLIDKAVVKAKTLDPQIRPLKVAGEDKYCLFIHPYQHYQLRTNTNTAQYMDIQKAAIQGGQISKNPIYTGAIAEYNGVVLHESTRVPNPTGSVRRAVFCGAQAGCLAVGRDTATDLGAKWSEELFDYGNQLGVGAGLIFGLKKSIFNSKDFATIVISSFSPAP